MRVDLADEARGDLALIQHSHRCYGARRVGETGWRKIGAREHANAVAFGGKGGREGGRER